MDKLNLIEIEIDLKQELQRKQRHLSNRDQCRTTNDRWDLKTLLFIAKKKKNHHTTQQHQHIHRSAFKIKPIRVEQLIREGEAFELAVC